SLTAVLLIPSLSVVLAEEERDFKVATPQSVRIRDGIPHFLSKLANKEEMKIAYFGGSITAANGWRVQTLAKFNEMFPDSKFTEINAAIGGTGSDLGVYRLEHDVLRHNPDLVFVEFCVNDGGASYESIWRQMEGIVRQIWKHSNETDVVFVYTYRVGHENDYLAVKTPRSVSAMEQIADFYGIPSLDFNLAVVGMHEAGKLTYQADSAEEGKLLFSNDGVHPLVEGHEIYTKVVTEAFEEMRQRNEKKTFPSVEVRKEKLNNTFVADNYEDAKLVPIEKSQLLGTWTPLPEDSPLNWIKSRLGDVVYTSDSPSSQLKFKFKGSHAAVYDVLGPDGGQVWVTVDGKRREKPVARFDSFCTYHRLATLVLAGDLDPNVTHEVVVEIDKEQPDRTSVAFRLQNPEKELAEPKYQGRNVWFGPLMIIGEVVE
ncbi:MAG: SGNH/GDSL hydrolase family protein, partial [Thermoguttaceae bacterium]